MVKTMEEFRDELKAIRADMAYRGRYADSKLVASWLDRLIIAMEGITPALGMIEEEISQISESGECSCKCDCPCCCGGKAQKAKPAKAKKPAKKGKKRK